MKILKYGDGYPKTVTCDNCQSELEYDFKDVLKCTDILEEIIVTGFIACPVCGNNIEIYRYTRPVPGLKLEEIKPKKRWWRIYD